ncbi:EAL domain-containing protein [Sphingorhabdus sp.]|uniref:EAL domain-containing protein n=1 Tax=Sphingorhabdus sp. TaxID=1902408 RepID=UPI003983029D
MNERSAISPGYKTRGHYTLRRARDARDWLSGEPDGPVTILLLGIKDLKQINEHSGRGVGDIAIRRVGERLRAFAAQQLSPISFMARMPGREFMLVIKGNDAGRQVELAAQKLIEMVSADLGDSASPLHVSARVAIALSKPGESRQQLAARATQALAHAYERKGQRFVIADSGDVSDAPDRSQLDAAMRSALAQRQIAIMLQPQFAVATGALVGAEALARLNHPVLGEISAGDLFASADRCDLREELSYHIQQEAIAIAAGWPAAFRHLRLAVNLGAEELTAEYGSKLLRLLEVAGFAADRLTLELTEESLVRDLQLAAGQLEMLRQKGVRIAVDDFGTGYSSLAYLKALPLDYLKIDKDMTPDITGDGKDRIILRAIIAMAKALELLIIAEGVQEQEELEMLKAEGCDFFQGYLRAPPLTPAKFEALARDLV